MAQYYVDGTITSANGSGSGTLADPWGKTDDLFQYAVDQILAGAGAGANGDWVNVVAGDLTATASVDLSSYSGSQKHLYLVGHNGHQPTYDLGGEAFFVASYYGTKLHNIRFVNFSTTVSSIALGAYSTISKCIFDGQNQDYRDRLVYLNAPANVFGCQWINFANTNVGSSGTLLYAPSGRLWIKGCYFEKGGDDRNTMVSARESVTEDCIYRYSGSGILYYAHLATSSSRFSNCTFYRVDGQGPMNAVFFSNYNDMSMVNCYFENANPIYNSHSTVDDNVITMLSGNRSHNTNVPSHTGKALIEHDNQWDVSESLLVDPLNGDYRPKAALIGAGFNLQDYGFPSSIKKAKPTIGGINAFETVAKPSPRVRG